ncbi:MAG: ammonium transporter, partial [Thermomicrobiales bacterium]
NAGSALGANALAANAFVVTNVSAGMAALTWMTVSWLRHGQPSVLGAVAGAVAGLVAITPAAGFVDPSAAIAIGFGAGVICFFAVELLKKRVDDALDVFAVHGVGGIWGALATGIFAQKAVNDAGNNGLLYGNPHQLLVQAIAVVASASFAAVLTVIILKAIDLVIGLRVPEQDEVLGLDTTQHGEIAYQL